MRRSAFIVVLLFGALLAIPAMADKIDLPEMSDMELAEISAQGWGPGIQEYSDMIAEPASDLAESQVLSMNSLTQDHHGFEINLAPTTIHIDSITSDTQFGTFVIGDLSMKVQAKVTVVY